MKPQHVTLEPNEHNVNSVAVTLYVPGRFACETCGSSKSLVEKIKDHLKKGRPFIGSLSVDVNDPSFAVEKTRLQPFPGYVRFQAHPTG